MCLYSLAFQIAQKAHEGQVDKAGKPYIEHPLRLAATFSDETRQCIALLHDVVEDSDITPDDLRKAGIPEAVVEAVVALTHRPHEENDVYYQRIKQNPLALAVKLADIEDDTNPARLELLDEKTRVRLKQKYARAKKMLLD